MKNSTLTREEIAGDRFVFSGDADHDLADRVEIPIMCEIRSLICIVVSNLRWPMWSPIVGRTLQHCVHHRRQWNSTGVDQDDSRHFGVEPLGRSSFVCSLPSREATDFSPIARSPLPTGSSPTEPRT